MRSGLTFCESSFCYTFYSCEDIRSQICTCHVSSAVVACAKLWPYIIISVAVKANIFELWAHGLFVKSVPATNSADTIYLTFEHQLLFTSHSFYACNHPSMPQIRCRFILKNWNKNRQPDSRLNFLSCCIMRNILWSWSLHLKHWCKMNAFSHVGQRAIKTQPICWESVRH